ncbi:uncharacterized protein JCM6883_005356 [Sporobolomyces salmoneus]|uniref:uncharacterized protein n=1 Tax=Sporobolomyces salmoneus TaxID=183962 RepID=UPI00316D6446
MTDPVNLFNDAQLSIIVPYPSSLSHCPPHPSTLSSPADSTTDAWINALLQSRQRHTTYYDESLTFYLVLTLASSASLSRPQAHSFFLQSLPEPHLTLATSMSYYESAATRPPPPPRTHSALVSSHFPLTPNPHPSTSNSATTVDPTTSESVLVSTKSFDERDDDESGGDGEKQSKVWIGQTLEGDWTGVWEFSSALPYIQTSFHEPKLALTVTVTFRDEPKLDRLLALTEVNGSSENAEGESRQEAEEDYMDDSYDDVNLLSSLGPSQSFHLPFSRLPPSFLAPLSTAPPSPHARRHSRSYSLNSTSLDPTLVAPSPLLRRSILKTFDLRRPLQVSFRTIDCSIPDDTGSRGGHGHDTSASSGGMVVLLELAGPRDTDQAFEIEDVKVRATSARGGIESSIGGSSSDVEVKRVTSAACSDDKEEEDQRRIRLGSNDQLNYIYKLSLSPSSQLLEQQRQRQQTLPLAGLGLDQANEGLSSVPIAVATSPSQRFTARFGTSGEDGIFDEVDEEDELDRRRERERERERQKREEVFRRNLEVTVRGRVLVRRKRAIESEGYTVEEAETSSNADEEKEEWTSPTQEISSRSNYPIDISSFAYQPPPLQAHLLPAASYPSSSRQLARPSSIAVGQIPLLPPSAIRPLSTSANGHVHQTEIESIAGSKRHTMASLASLSLKSPVLGRRGGSHLPLPPQYPERPIPQRHGSSRRPSPLPHIATSGPAAAPRRFFSLPPASQESTPTSATFPNRRQTETPPPMNPVSPGVTRNSLPLQPQPTQTAEGNRRSSWMSGLGIGKGTNASTSEGITSWDTVDAGRGGGGATNRESGGLGLGLVPPTGSNSPLPPLPPQSSLPPRPSEIDGLQYQQFSQSVPNGRLLVTVSLVPLRTVKSRRPLNNLWSNSTNPGMSELPPATLPGLTSTLSPPATHHASFNFPPSSPASPTSPSPIDSPSLDSFTNGTTTPIQYSEAQKNALRTSRMPRVGLLDVFLVQLFVVNQTDQVKRFVVGVPTGRRPKEGEMANGGGRAGEGAKPRGQELGVRSAVAAQNSSGKMEDYATLVPLENGIRIGPLAPDSCASLGLRMLAISPGAHVLEELKLVDLADGSETRLEKPLWVVVE